MSALKTISKDNVLIIPELLSHIFKFSTKECIANAMCVCTLWADVGKPYVWRELGSESDLDGLLRLLVSWTDDVSAPELLIPHSVDWQRFLQYSSLVHYLSLTARVQSDEMNRVRAAALNFIVESRPVYDVFPNLQTLVCAAAEEEVFRPFLAFLHSGVTHLFLNVPRNSDMGGILIHVQRLSSLVYVELYDTSYEIDFLRPALAFLQQLPSLATIVLPSRSATYPILETLSKFPALEVIQGSISIGYGYSSQCTGRHPDSRSFERCAFPMLNTLTMSGSSYQLSQLLDDENFPFHIQTLTVEVVECSNNPVAALQKISAKCSRVINFTLIDTTECAPSPFSLLKPFLTYSLTRLRVQAACPLSYALSEIEELAQSLPRVEFLSLEDCPKPWISSIPPGNYPKLTFEHLPIFARHCQRLSQFEIQLDTTQLCLSSLSDIVPFAALCELNLLRSFAYFIDFPGLDGAATVLSELLPSYCRLTCEETSLTNPPGTAGTIETIMVPEDAGKSNVWYTKKQLIRRWLGRRMYVPQSASDIHDQI